MIYETENILIEALCDWEQFLNPSAYNWHTFRFASFEIENDKMLGGLEVQMVFLGLGFRARWNHSDTELTDRISQEIDQIQSVADKP